MNKSHYYTIFVFLFLIAIIFGLVYFQAEFKKEKANEPKTSVEEKKEIISPTPKIVPTPTVFLTPTNLPPIVSQVEAEIKEVKGDRLILIVSHPYFDSGKPRRVEAIFDEDTTVFSRVDGQVLAQGKDGLKLFQSGLNISVKSDENIQVKDKFKATSIIK